MASRGLQVRSKKRKQKAQTKSANKKPRVSIADEGREQSAQNKKAVDNANENGQNKSAATGGAGVVVTGDEFGEYKDIKELRKKAEAYYKEYLQGTSVSNPILGKVNLENTDILQRLQ